MVMIGVDDMMAAGGTGETKRVLVDEIDGTDSHWQEERRRVGNLA